jgi:hypothetical protein
MTADSSELPPGQIAVEDRLSAREIKIGETTLLVRHATPVCGLAFAADGRTLVTAGADGRLLVTLPVDRG